MRDQPRIDRPGAMPGAVSVAAKVRARAARQNGVVMHSQLLAAGLSKDAIARWVSRGLLTALFRGVYLVAAPVPPPLHRETAAMLAAGPKAVVSHLAAARIWALDLPARLNVTSPEDEVIDITVPGAKRRRVPGMRIHTRPLAHWERSLVGPLRVATASRAILDLVPELSDRELEQMVAEAIRSKRVRRRALEVQVERSRTRTGVKRLRRLLERDALRMTRSGGEKLLVATLSAAGIEPPLTNVEVEGRELDAYWPQERVGIELQSRRWHGDADSLERDSEKASLLAALGYTLLPFTADQVRRRPELVIARTRMSLENAHRRDASASP